MRLYVVDWIYRSLMRSNYTYGCMLRGYEQDLLQKYSSQSPKDVLQLAIQATPYITISLAARSAIILLESALLRPKQYGDFIILKKCSFLTISNFEGDSDYNVQKVTFDKTPHIEFNDKEFWNKFSTILIYITILMGKSLSKKKNNISTKTAIF